VLAAQGFASRGAGGQRSWPVLSAMLDRLALLQLDSVSVLVRSHYLPLFSRLGGYDRAELDRRAAGPRRALFEYWAHEASLLPLALHPLLRWRMARARRLDGIYGGIARFAADNGGYLEAVLAELRERGPLSARELSDPGTRSGPWWGWHKGKLALEFLFWSGAVTTAARRGFERVYGLTEQVLPAAVLDLPTPEEDEAQRALVEIAARALGVATIPDLRDYFRLTPEAARRAVEALSEGGVLLPVSVEGWSAPAFLHRDAQVPARVSASALVSPFDPLVWERNRCARLFGFDYRLEFYTPAEKRRYGYYVMPFLLGDRLVARIDLKADRQGRRLLVLGAFGEPGVRPQRVAGPLRDTLERLARWLDLEQVEVLPQGDLAGSLSTR